MKHKSKFKQLFAGVMAALTTFVSVVGPNVPTYAASATSAVKFWYASVKDSGIVSELDERFNNEKILYAVIDGHIGYCMNFGLDAHKGQLMTSYDTPRTEMSEKQRKELAYCLYYGYNSTSDAEPNNDQKDRYVATQAMVWIIEKDIFGTESADSAARKLCDTAPDPDTSYSYYSTIKSQINSGMNLVRPSFAGENVFSVPEYELKWNATNQRFEITLTDTNNVLSEYDFSLAGYTTEQRGNTLTISSKTVNTTSVLGTFESNTDKKIVSTSTVFWLTGNSIDQEFVSAEDYNVDPVTAYIRVWTEEIGYCELYKKDKDTQHPLAGVTFGIYREAVCQNLVATMTTNTNGYAKSGELPAGTYYVKETATIAPYVLSKEVYTVTVQAGQTSGISAFNSEQRGDLTVYKEGEVLTGWNGKNFVYEKKRLPGITFELYAGADIRKANGETVYHKGDLVSRATTDSNGSVHWTNLYLGTYEVKEVNTLPGYKLESDSKVVVLGYTNSSESISYQAITILNKRQTAKVTVTKNDSDTENPLPGASFTLYAGSDIFDYQNKLVVSKGTALQTIVTDKNGKATFTVDMPINCAYYVKETKAPTNYLRNKDDVFSFRFDYLDSMKASTSFTHTFSDERVKAEIKLVKKDGETGSTTQGDATFEGAVYGLYAREPIVHPDGATGILYSKDELVATLRTDKDGYASVDGLYLGKYYVKEIEAPVGYLLDPDEHDIDCKYEGDRVAVVKRTAISEEQVKKQPFCLIKVSDDGKETEADTLASAGFTAYLKSSLALDEDGSYDFDSADPIAIGSKGETTLYTDNKGYLETIAIPYGTYVVVETVVPHNMAPVKPFEVTISEHNPDTPQTWRIFIDREFSAKLKIYKVDEETKKPILKANTEFKIYDMDHKKYVSQITTYPKKEVHTSFYTNEDGYLVLPETLSVGHYRIEEVNAPEGYVLNKNYVNVTIDTDTFYEIDPDTNDAVIEVTYEDKAVTGKLIIYKKGEKLMDYRKKFIYKSQPLAGAEFVLIAAEDIYTPDMQKMDGKRIKIYSKDEIVATLVTNEDGIAELDNIPLGTYRLMETKAPEGFVCYDLPQAVTFSYKDQNTEVVYEGVDVNNARQKVEISVLKMDEKKQPVEGAVFGLYAAEDIANAKGEVIVTADTLLEKAESDENGSIGFITDFPFGKYYVKELEAPAGYVTDQEKYYLEATYQGDRETVVKLVSEVINSKTKLYISKTDITGEYELEGATLSVIDKNGNIVETWISTTEPHYMEMLPVGTYMLREETAPYGYKIANDVIFEVKDTKEVQMVSMKDELVKGMILIDKTDETNGKALEGVEFELRDKDGNVIETLVTDKKGHAESKVLDIAAFKDGKYVEDIKYYLVETKALEGYELDDTVHEIVLHYEGNAPDIVKCGYSFTNKPDKPDYPKTGDNTPVYPFIALAFASMAGCVAIAASSRKKKEEIDSEEE